jgi:hypothetical protein
MAPLVEPVRSWPIAAIARVVMLGLVSIPAVAWPTWGWLVPVALLLLLGYGIVASRIHAARLRRERAGLSICEFARSFPRRDVDTWVIRAVWRSLAFDYPLRADDRLLDDLGMDDIDSDFAWERVADDCGRSLEHPEQNPYYSKVVTLRDLVLFLNAQPRLRPAA